MTSKINIFKKFSGKVLLILSLFIAFSTNLSANEEPVVATEELAEAGHPAVATEKKIDITAIAFEHILDAHSWHLWGEGHDALAIPLPIIIYSNTKGLQFFMSSRFEHGHAEFDGYSLADEAIVSSDPAEKVYDFSITKNVAQMFISVIVLLVLFTSIAKTYKTQGVTTAPKGKQSFFEPLVVFVRDDLAKTNIGATSDKYVPYLLTVFFLILINNVFGLIPIGANLTGNIAFTFVLSVCTFILTNMNGNKHYWGHIFLPHAPKALWIILIPIELLGIFIKPFALMIRLFANMTAGHIIIISLIGLIFYFESLAIAPISVAFALFIDILEVLVAFLQAYIFTMLTALFIGSAVADTNEDGAHTSDDAAVASNGH